MNILVKKTIDMSEKEKNDICLLYGEVFGKIKSLEKFIHEFEDNEFGYSYYSLMYDDDILVGSYAVIPFKFIYLESELIFGQAVNTMIKEKYRGNPFSLKKMAKVVDSQNKKDSNYQAMADNFENSIAFKAACDLVFLGTVQENGYTEPLLHRYRLAVKKQTL